MEGHALEELFRDWDAAGVAYLVVGGLAVVAHGYAQWGARRPPAP